MASNTKRFLVRQNGILREICSVAQDSAKDQTVRISLNMGPSIRAFEPNTGWQKHSPVALHKFSIHPADNSNPPAFIVTHTVKSGNLNGKGYIRIAKGDPRMNLYFIPICYILIGRTLKGSNISKNSIIISEYDCDKDILFISLSASSENLNVSGTYQFGSRCFKFDRFRIYLNYTFLDGSSSIGTHQTVPYTIHPDAPKIIQEEFDPVQMGTLEYMNIAQRFLEYFPISRERAESAGDKMFSVRPAQHLAFPARTYSARGEFEKITILDEVIKNRIEFWPEDGNPIVKIGRFPVPLYDAVRNLNVIC